MSAIRPRSRIRDRPRSTVCAGPGDRRAGQRPRRRQGGQRLQEAQPRLGHRRRRAHHRSQPRQPVGPGLRAGDARVGLRQRHGRLDAVLRRRAQEHPGDPAARGRHPRRRSDRDGVQRHGGFKVGGAPAHFIFDSEAGTITAWNSGTQAVTEATTPDAVYKGLAIASKGSATLLYAANFHSGQDRRLQRRASRRSLSPGGFADPNLPAGFAPFNVQEIAGRICRRLRQAGPRPATSVAGPGHGYVDVFDTGGHLLRRLISQGALNAPWGLAVAPGTSGRSAETCWSATSATGAINAYDPRTRQLPGHADEQGRQPDQDQRPLGAALRQRRDRHAADAPVHRRASATRTTASSARSSSAAAASQPTRPARGRGRPDGPRGPARLPLKTDASGTKAGRVGRRRRCVGGVVGERKGAGVMAPNPISRVVHGPYPDRRDRCGHTPKAGASTSVHSLPARLCAQ